MEMDGFVCVKGLPGDAVDGMTCGAAAGLFFVKLWGEAQTARRLHLPRAHQERPLRSRTLRRVGSRADGSQALHASVFSFPAMRLYLSVYEPVSAKQQLYYWGEQCAATTAQQLLS